MSRRSAQYTHKNCGRVQNECLRTAGFLTIYLLYVAYICIRTTDIKTTFEFLSETTLAMAKTTKKKTLNLKNDLWVSDFRGKSTDYRRGYLDGKESNMAALNAMFEKNTSLAAECTSRAIEILRSDEISPIDAYLKINRASHMSVLFTVSETDYLSPNLISAINSISNLEDSVSSESFRITFSFTDKSEFFDYTAVHSDGFSYKHKTLIGD
jgi:hypothetical protein